MSLGDETLHWTIDLENEEELFDLFGAKLENTLLNLLRMLSVVKSLILVKLN